MTLVNTYLTFDGTCEEAMNFYREVFGGEFTRVSRFEEMPPQENMPRIPESQLKKILHMALPISKETTLMGSDMGDDGTYKSTQGNNFSISVSTDSKDEADRIFHELSDGGKISMHMDKTFWGSYFGMLTDKFGINWMVSFDQEGSD